MCFTIWKQGGKSKNRFQWERWKFSSVITLNGISGEKNKLKQTTNAGVYWR